MYFLTFYFLMYNPLNQIKLYLFKSLYIIDFCMYDFFFFHFIFFFKNHWQIKHHNTKRQANLNFALNL